jgi:arsenate reductase
MNTKPIRVLFLCTGNSARSIIAEALLKHMGGPAFEVYSAGTHPKGLNPFTEQVLRQDGSDPSAFHSKGLQEFAGQSFDYVITVCDQAQEECPVLPNDTQRIHWSFADPAAVQGSDLVKLAAFQETLRGMRQRISLFIPVAQRSRAEVGT